MISKFIENLAIGFFAALLWLIIILSIQEWLIYYEQVMPGSVKWLWRFAIGFLAFLSFSFMKFGSKHNFSKPKLLILGYSPLAAHIIFSIPFIIIPSYRTSSLLNEAIDFLFLVKIFIHDSALVLIFVSAVVVVYYFYNFLRNRNWVKAWIICTAFSHLRGL